MPSEAHANTFARSIISLILVLSPINSHLTLRLDPIDTKYSYLIYFHVNCPTLSCPFQFHNGLCVLTQNIINEKIYLVLWFWYIFLGNYPLACLSWSREVLLFELRPRLHPLPLLPSDHPDVSRGALQPPLQGCIFCFQK